VLDTIVITGASASDAATGPLVQACGRALYPLREDLLGYLKDWRNAQMDVLRQSRALTDLEQQRWWSALATDDRQALFGLFLQSPDAPLFIGYGGLVNLDRVNGRAEVSFLVDPQRSSQPGVYVVDMRAAFSMFCWYGFERLGLNRLFTETFSFRQRHIEVLGSLGFRMEGILRQHVKKDGKYWDSVMHGILHSEWKHIGEQQ
jgi:RimJ/RimL family protein N-acetyltransferase